LGVSLWQTNKYVLKIIGHRSKNLEEKRGVEICPYPFDPYLPLFRLFIPFYYLFKIWSFRPSLQIICSWELLPVAVLFKGIFGSRVIYDVQENYSLNVQILGNAPSIINNLKRFWIRWHERIAFPYVDEFWCAEPNYPRELKLPKDKCSIVLNKALKNRPLPTKPKANLFLYSGTVGPSQGLYETLEWWRQQRRNFPDWHLWIIGHCPDAKAFQKLRGLDAEKEQIKLQVSRKPIPYTAILEAIQEARAGILAYVPNEANASKIPTKLFEYAANGCCIIQLQPNPFWSDWIALHQAGIHTLSISDSSDLRNTLENWKPVSSLNPDLLWQSQERAILQSIEKLHSLNLG
jgi:hypothetical protein